MLAMAQTETKKVIQMSVVRTVGQPVTTYLLGDDDFVGPTYNRETKVLSLTGTNGTNYTVARQRLKEIRFSIETIEVPTAIEAVNESNLSEQPIYDLSGRPVTSHESLGRGIYIIGNKKYVKK